MDKFLGEHGGSAVLRTGPDGSAQVMSQAEAAAHPFGATVQKGQPVTRTPALIAAPGSKTAADHAESMIGLSDRVPSQWADIKKYLDNGGHGMDPATGNWCASFVSASLRKAGYPDVPGGSGNVAFNYMNWGTPVAPKDVQRGDIMVGGTQGHRPGQNGGHVAIVRGGPSDGRIPIVEGDQRLDPVSYATSPGSVYSKTKTGPEYTGGHKVGTNTVGLDEEGMMFRRPPQRTSEK